MYTKLFCTTRSTPETLYSCSVSVQETLRLKGICSLEKLCIFVETQYPDKCMPGMYCPLL